MQPLRAFWEAHQSLLRAPPLEIVNNYLEDSSWTKVKIDRKSKLRNSACVDGGQRNTSETAAESQEDLKKKLQALLQTPALTELLTLEMEAEKMEVALGEALFPFTELARIVDHKRAHLNVVSGVLEATDFPALQETIRVSIQGMSSERLVWLWVDRLTITSLLSFFRLSSASQVHSVSQGWRRIVQWYPSHFVGPSNDPSG